MEDLQRYKSWLAGVARSKYPHRESDWNDLIQEGLVAMWQAAQTYPPGSSFTLDTHMKMAGRYRIIAVAAGKATLGKPSTKGSFKIPSEIATDLAAPEMESLTPMILDPCDGREMAYHSQEIMEAIQELPPLMGRRVIERFWNDHYEGKHATWWTARGHGARDRLRVRLAHLQDGVF
jgi:sigma-70-like protein